MDSKRLQKELEANGSLARIQKLASAEEIAAAARSVDQEKLKAAAENKDPVVMRAVLEQLLSTDAGKRLAEKVKAAMENG